MQQINFLKKLKKFQNSNIDNSNVANYYLTSFSQTPGFLILKKIKKEKINLFLKFKIIVLNILGNYKLIGSKIFFKKLDSKYNSIIITWGRINNFQKDGSFYDLYFNQNSKYNKNFLWFIISLDNQIPRNIGKNIIVFYQKKKNLFSYLLSFFLITKKILFNFYQKKNFYFIENLSVELFEKFESVIQKKNIKRVIMPYEAQPFQNYLFSKISKKNNKIKNIGYVHSTQLFPSHLFKRKGAPETLYVHGSDQKFHLSKFFGWSQRQIKETSSFRYQIRNKKRFIDKIFLPYDFFNEKILVNTFKKILVNKKEFFSKSMEIVLHPHTLNSKKHIRLKNHLTKILSTSSFLNKDKNKGNMIVFGATSIILEALENKLTPLHICEDVSLEAISNKVWPSIQVETILDNCFKYKLKQYNKCINYNNKNKNLNFFK